MRYIGPVQPILALFDMDVSEIREGHRLARAELLERVPDACILSVHDIERFEENSTRWSIGILYVRSSSFA
jgi:hypothetical protein